MPIRDEKARRRSVLVAGALIALISFTYLALPTRFQFIKSDWQDAALIVMMTSILIAILGRDFKRNLVFWTSLVISSPIHLVIVHVWTQRVPKLSRGDAKLAALLGFALFLAIYGFAQLLRWVLNNEEVLTSHSGGASPQ